ncbi:LysR family transcriptional regulator [Vibrio sp. CAU 1672]|uniref:LysR family transcriptional regulator n=1 Tax=Vibrio sp. CAU 1672 TaxID=3032594 RepID=UPI0023DC8D8B|nr:LysR family transcriptional regulator [Vibrio sp. CAU 1672]MDF2152871.1 LysR substrate-binding domain-containing protein [Vibrio sp. CAU 1672]
MQTHINLADIRSFVLIAQLGNFTKAAEALAVSRSHVSRQISQLEKQMGVTLLLRTTRTLKLTEAGKTFYSQCEAALHRIDQAVLAAVDDVEEVRGEIRINCVGGYLGEEVVADLVAAFMKQYPQVRIELDFSSHRVDLIEDEFDIAFRMGKLEDSGFVSRKLIDVEMGTYASPGYLQQYGHPAHPKDLEKHHCLTGTVTRWAFSHKMTQQSAEYHVRGQLRCKNGRVMLKGALADNGIIRVPRLYCLQELEQGALQEVFSEWTIPSVEFSALYHRDRYQPNRIRTFIEFTVEYFRQLQQTIPSV